MTARPLFRPSAQSNVAHVALVSITVTGAVVYTDVRCTERVSRSGASHPCHNWLFALPGVVSFTLRRMESNEDRTGQGIAVRCQRCGTRSEVIQGAQP